MTSSLPPAEQIAETLWTLPRRDDTGRGVRRVGVRRVFYDVVDDLVEVLAIVAKSEAESWLAQFGSPE
jgi:hypothetical protein